MASFVMNFIIWIAPAYPVLFVLGGMVWQHWIGKENKHRWPGIAIIAFLVVGGLVTLPLSVPLLPVKKLIAYQKSLGLMPEHHEKNEVGELPQYFADRFGWEKMAATVSQTWQALPESEREQCVIYTDNYGRASSLNYFRKKYPLPKVVCGHNNHYFWGLDGPARETVLFLDNVDIENLKPFYEQIDKIGHVQTRYSMPYESSIPLFLCKKLKKPWKEVWKLTKHFI